MKFRLIILNILFYSIILADPVDLNRAERVASNIYAERSNSGTIDGFNVSSVNILDDNSISLIYIFQLDTDGFIMVSGDDRVQPLLAYSFESRFILDDMPVNLSWIVDAYKGMVKYAIDSEDSSTEKVISVLDFVFIPTSTIPSVISPPATS